MKKQLLLVTALAFMMNLTFANENDGVKIKISENKLDKIYKVFFGSVEPIEVTISILNSKGNELQSETTKGYGFEKQYSLSKLPNGLYTFVLKYDDEEYTHDVFLKSKKDMWKESIVVKEHSDKVEIHVEEFNQDPVSVFFLRKDGSWVVYDFWETENNRDKVYLKEKFEGASKIEIIQNGEIVLSRSLAYN